MPDSNQHFLNVNIIRKVQFAPATCLSY